MENKKETKETAKQNVHDTVFGIPSEDIFSNLSGMEEQIKENDLYHDLKHCVQNNEILWGKIYGTESFNNHVVICVLWNGVKVSIPDNLYFEPEFDFGKGYSEMTKEEQFNRRQQVAKQQINAVICFTVLKVERSKIQEGGFKDQYTMSVIGNRSYAMELLRDIYFWHKNRKDKKTAPRSVEVGDIVKAHVIGVKEEKILVEVAGIETRIGRRDLSDKVFVDNCHDFVSPGDTMNVKVKNLYINKDNIHLGVTGKLGVGSKNIKNMRIGGSYIGRVTSAGKGKCYSVLLSNGVIASINRSQVSGNMDLFLNDTVQVYVVKIYDTYVSGSAIKK